MKKLLLLLFANLLIAFTYAQNRTYILSGDIKSNAGVPISEAHVKIKNGQTTISNNSGKFSFELKKNKSYELFVSHISYQDTILRIWNNKSDSIFYDIILREEINELKTFDVFEKSKPEKVFGLQFFDIQDFEFGQNEEMILLTSNKSLEKDPEIVVVKNEEIINRAFVKQEAKQLFKDYKDNVFVECDKSVYKLNEVKQNVDLFKVDFEAFEKQLKSCVDEFNEKIVYSDYKWYYPSFNYYFYNPFDTSSIFLKNIIDEPLMRMYRFEYYYMQPQEKLQARRYAMKNNFDKHDVAALMTNFHNSLYYRPLYAPLLVVNDTAMVFDHYANHIYKYDEFSRCIDSVSISYHETKPRLMWKKQIVKDEVTESVYALYQKNGYFILNLIDVNTGEIAGSYTLYNKYVEKVRVKDDYVYYIYRPFESAQKKYLYKELIKIE